MNNNLSKMTILLHWLTGLTFILVLALGLYFDYLPRGPEKGEIMGLHKSFGAIVFVVAVARLIWRFKEGSIKPISELSRLQSIVSTSVHHLLLLATVMMPLSGIVMSISGGRGLNVFGFEVVAGSENKVEWLAQLANSIHTGAVIVILVLLFLHVAGGLKHQLIDKDGTISRMLGNFHR
ncbi:cytochrome B [Psychromonas sp. psych-6C06]|uniref:cytochrome b n=1 Tax=Psychromonas sp. psych-6C06 TaxID=2058089 RepID=UPI000C322F18|nr:cytochrome b [Psychromonas sp. psych-6C06]PKF62809.1 cytochrome B [Psychromonas sp. psych-6C06]